MNASKILVVDDTPDLLDLYSAFLQEEGYHVLSAENGQNCLRLVQQEKPDLVVLDVMLPDINGLDVCRKIKANPETEGTFVVNISGRMVSDDRKAEGLEAGADGYLTKPFEKRTLIAHIQALLRIKEAEEQLRKSELTFRAAFENAVDVMSIFDDKGRFIDANPAAEKMFGMTRDQLLSRTLSDFVDRASRNKLEEDWIALLKQQTHDGELQLSQLDDTRIVEFRAKAHFLPGRHLAVLRDVTERKKMEEALGEINENLEKRVQQRTAELLATNSFLRQEIVDRERAQENYERANETRKQLLQKLVNTQEEERQRLSRELHDQFGQSLAALLLGLKALADSGEVAADGREQLKKLEKLTNQLAQDAHTLARDLRPTALDDLGLETALTNYVDEWSERSGIPADVHFNGLLDHRLPVHIETAIYRIVQEALTNIIKHAQPTQVSVIIENRAGRVLAIVEDNGCGFDVDSIMNRPAREQRLGLLGMQERAMLLGGSLTLESTPNVGTMVMVTIPLEG